MLIDKKIKELEKEIAKLQKEKEKSNSRRQWVCPGCKKRTSIKKLDLVVHWYEYDTWDHDWTSSNDFKICCPHCQNVYRFYDPKQPGWKEICKLKNHFGGEIRDYAKESPLNSQPEIRVERSIQFNWNDRSTFKKFKTWDNAPPNELHKIFGKSRLF